MPGPRPPACPATASTDRPALTTLAQVYDSLLGVGLSETVDLAEYLRALCQRLPGLQAARKRRFGSSAMRSSLRWAWTP